MNNPLRVVVTGIGLISPLGLSLEDNWTNLLLGKSGIDHIKSFDADGLPIKIAGEIKEFNPLDYMDPRTVRRMSRTSQLALATVKIALEDSKFDLSSVPGKMGICLGTGVGCLDKVVSGLASTQGMHSRVDPFGIIASLSNTPAALISSQLQLTGPSTTIVTACASGIQAIGEAAEQIRRGWTELIVCGGIDAPILRVSFHGFGAMGLLANNADPAKACRPFDLNRSGLVLSEGSAFFVLEEINHALDRKAPIYGEILGFSAKTDSGSLFQPDQSGDKAAESMGLAITRAGLDPDQIQYIHAHGTATIANDIAETKAIKTVFGKDAYHIPISSSKSMLGHTMGASGAIGTAISLKVINENIIPPTINLDHPDPECDLDYVPNVARKAPVNFALVNAFGLGGQNACLVLGKA